MRSYLVCFWDMNQRPSRNCILELVKQSKELEEKSVAIVLIQASGIDEDKLNDWVKKNSISFHVGMIEGDEEEIRFKWGVKSLPWLILTDKKHIVNAEGLSINELKVEITKLRDK